VLTFDGKGVVMRQEALREATRKKAAACAQKLPSAPSSLNFGVEPL